VISKRPFSNYEPEDSERTTTSRLLDLLVMGMYSDTHLAAVEDAKMRQLLGEWVLMRIVTATGRSTKRVTRGPKTNIVCRSRS